MSQAELIRWIIGAMLIAVGLPLFYVGRYLSAPSEEKKRKARDIKIIAIVWIAVGVLIYISALFLH
jgi:hypothetical protein